MSICNKCKMPGACCHGFMLFDENNNPRSYWVDEGDEAVIKDMKENGLPFLPLATAETHYDPVSGHQFRSVYMQCPRLGADGKCTDYAHRPQLCRDYKAGVENTCRMSPRFRAARIYHLTEILGAKPSVFEEKG